MERRIDSYLASWATQPAGRPLLVRGARRVGKTHAVRQLEQVVGRERFAYCDFQTDLDRLSAVFDGTTDVERIVADLALLLRKDIRPHDTVVALDEVQLSEKALNSLRFFANSGYRVVATGSQLGLTLRNRTLPFPSDVEHVFLRPMDFEEFLWAVGERAMADGIRRCFQERRPFVLHDEALERYYQYLAVGGMPGVVAPFAQRGDYQEVRRMQADICSTYTADIALYAPADTAVRAQAIWASIPAQLARETTRKFKYADVSSGGRERMYRPPLAWLESAELVNLNYQTNGTAAPLVRRDDGSYFKVYLLDTGLMLYRYNIDAEILLDPVRRQQLAPTFRGALAENYVMQQLTARSIETFYWTPGTASSNEVEFVVQNRRGHVVPIEVKSGPNVRSASLARYREKSGAPYGVRLSATNFGFENGLYSVPLYAAFCLDETSLTELEDACA